MKALAKRLLHYEPQAATAEIRRILNTDRVPGRAYCPDSEGDLIHALITAHDYRRCLQTGFGTGSTALYMLLATERSAGTVLSLDWSPNNFNEIGRRHLAGTRFEPRHTLVEEPSYKAMSRLLQAETPFDFVFLDGWKTFDYLAHELFIINRLLTDGGCVMFDDSHMPSVHRAIGMLVRHYGYEEIDYGRYGEPATLRMFQVLTSRTLRRPYRAFRKALPLTRQPPTVDYTFYRRF